MDIKIIPDDFDPNEYNSKAFHPLQSWEWGEARKNMGIKVLRISDGIDVFQITFHPIPYTSYTIGYLPRAKVPSAAVLDFLSEYGKSHNVVFIKMEPDVIKENKTPSLPQSPHPLFPAWTIVLDIQPSEEELLKGMKPKTRYNIRLAQKKGVVVREESNEKGFEIFSKLYFDTCKRQKYRGHTHQYHNIVWNNLKETIAHILIAYYNETPVATYELFFFKNKLYYPYGGTSAEYRNVMAANLIMWEAIQLGKRLGAEVFDMWGALPPQYDEKHPWAGFTRFKEGYGGSPVEMIGSFDLVINAVQYSLYNVLHKARSLLLSLF